MVDLPSGTVTFLFTDIHGSTRLWELNSQAMSSALARHDSILNSIISQRRGTVVKSRGEGDSFFAVFPRAADALAAATQIQLALHSESWPIEAPIRVRMALHTGEVQPRDGDYYGRAVNRCARLRAIAHGGQVVVSRATAELVWDTLPEGVRLSELGSHRLRDLERPEVVYQVEHPLLPGEFPPMKSLEVGGRDAEGRESSFVGRGREMEELRGTVGEALAGRGRLVMLAGQPGIGKTRTAQELAAVAEQQGARVLWGWCYEGEGAPPYWPWVQLIRPYVSQTNPEQLRSEMGPGASDIAGIVPEVRSKLPDLEPVPSLEPEQARFRLFDSVASFLNRVSEAQPLVLVMDDLHWADRSSLLLLQFLARQLGASRILVVGCYRDVELSREHPLSETLAQLSREPTFQRMLLRGLSYEDTGQFIEAMAGIRPFQKLTETIYAHTEGNPFFMREVVKLLVEEGQLTAEEVGGPQGVRVPEGVGEVIGQRLKRLSDLCNRTLTVASVIGRKFQMRHLTRLFDDLSEDRLLDVLEEALSARVIEELPTAVGHYQFTHILIQETLAQALSLSRRVRLHARIAESLEELYGPEAHAHADELAYHFAQSETLLGTDKMVRYSLVAGEGALLRYGYEEALVHFQRALAAKETEPMDDETAASLFGLGRAHAAFYRAEEAWDCLRRAFDYYAESTAEARAVEIAEYPIVLRPGDVEVIPVVERALTLVPSESPEAGRLLSRYGFAVSWEMGDYAEAEEAFRRALAIARREGDVGLETEVLTTASNVDFNNLCWRQCLENGLRAAELARGIGDPRAEARARRLIPLALLALGEPERAASQLKALSALAERLRNQVWRMEALSIDGELSRLRGDWQAAREFNERGPGGEAYIFLAQRAAMEHEVGAVEQGEVFLEQLLDVVQAGPPGPSGDYAYLAMAIAGVARITGTDHRLADAQTAAEAVLSSTAAPPMYAMGARMALGLAAVMRGDATAAGEHYAALEQQRGVIFPFGVMAVDRLLGLLAHTMGNLDEALGHFEESIAFCRKHGYRPELAWSLCDSADTLKERNGEGDREKAVSLLDESLAISTELGMSPLMERATALKEEAQSLPAETPAFPDGLTGREVEVLRLVAKGASNKEIADHLYISPNTVAHHITNILNKTGTSNRTVAAAYAAQHGLMLQ